MKLSPTTYQVAALCFALAAASSHMPATAQTKLSDGPVLSTTPVPGNLALALSVEFPTAVSVAHPNSNGAYSPTVEFIGYFDPDKCYDYKFNNDPTKYAEPTNPDEYSRFEPAGSVASPGSNRSCSKKWSGNFLNWATMQTIDSFRWALTGGYRVVDTEKITVLERAWASGQGGEGNFPNRSLAPGLVAGATPFAASDVVIRVQGLGNKFRMAAAAPAASPASFIPTYFKNKTLTAPGTTAAAESSINYNRNSAWPPDFPFDDISARWVGTVKATDAGTYTFRVRGDDGVRLRVKNGAIEYTLGETGWKDQGATNYDLTVPSVLKDATLSVEVEFYQGRGGAEISLSWKRPSDADFSVIGGANRPSVEGTPTHYNLSAAATPVPGTIYEMFTRVRVCNKDSNSGPLETNCTKYPSEEYKPTGLIQQYSDRMRYAAFGYLNDDALSRDGGVLRARMKYVGPTKPVPNSTPIASERPEWSTTTGVMIKNPDALTDAIETNASIANSGVMNYLNKFGQITPGNYKTYDPVGELYYAALRYFRKLGNVSSWTSGATAKDLDGFPAVTDWYKDNHDPILYRCQRNFILGIGDVNTHADRNLPGATGNSEPAKPSEVAADKTSDALVASTKIGALHGIDAIRQPFNCCTNNGALMAGLAYDANTSDIRTDIKDDQTVQTYWLDVLEYGNFVANNQFYLATKYGGFEVPIGYKPYDQAVDIPKSWWAKTTDLTPDGKARPDNYFTAANAKQMVNGLAKLFANIAAASEAYTTSFATTLPQIATTDKAAYASSYDPKKWTGDLIASEFVLENVPLKDKDGNEVKDKDGNTIFVEALTAKEKWKFSTVLAAQADGAKWDSGRSIVTYNTDDKKAVPFRLASLGTTQKALLNTSFVSGDDSQDFLNFLRGDRSKEVIKGGPYRERASLIGDIVNGRARPVGPPSSPLADSTNAGYSTFRESTTSKNRWPLVLVGTNQGMLHVVDGSLSVENSSSPGKELLAYVPGVLYAGPSSTPAVNGLQILGNPAFSHYNFVDAQPAMMDIDLAKTGGRSGSPNWRTVVVGGLGKGGRALYALDITDPTKWTNETEAAKAVLWERSSANSGYSNIGFTYSPPAIFKTKKWGWVIVVGNGHNPATGVGEFLFIDPSNGDLLETVTTGAGTASNPAGLSAISGFIPDARDGTADTIYAGDLLGNLWRLDVTAESGNYPAPVKLAELRDADNLPLAVTARPLVVIQPETDRRWVTVGTGRLLDETDKGSTQAQRFYAIMDGFGVKPFTAADLPSSVTYPIKNSNLRELINLKERIELNLSSEIGWYLDLGKAASGPGWRVITDSSAFFGAVTFASMVPKATDACDPSGDSRLYSIDLGTGQSELKGRISYLEFNGVVTDNRNTAFDGKNKIVVGLSSGKNPIAETEPQPEQKLRRLNWREVPQMD